MATFYLPDEVLMAYAAKHGGAEEAKQEIRELVEDNAPDMGGGSDE